MAVKINSLLTNQIEAVRKEKRDLLNGADLPLDDVKAWQNPRLKQSPMAVSGERLYKILFAMKSCYGVDFEFCDKYQTGKRIVELLKGGGGSA